jgi:hypothetical protein
MDEIRRTGPPKAVDARDAEIRVCVPLNESPSPEWVHFFQEFPSEWTTMAHPKLIDVELNALYFTSSEQYFAEWIRYIDRWIADANARYREYLDSLRRKQEAMDREDRERQRRIQEATEKLRGL